MTKMRVLFMGNNWAAWKVMEWLRDYGDVEIVGLVLHVPGQRSYGDEIINSSGVEPSGVLDASQIEFPDVLDTIRSLRPEVGVSVCLGTILRPGLLRLLPAGCVNLHFGFLPYNRGAYPNVWSIIDDTPAGVTLHYIDEGIDTGAIIARRQVQVEPTDTGVSLYRKLELASVELFRETWPAIRASTAPTVPQGTQKGSYHRVRDVQKIDEIQLDRQYTARELIDLMRARTFPPHPGAYFRVGQRKVYLRLELIDEEQLKSEGARAAGHQD